MIRSILILCSLLSLYQVNDVSMEPRLYGGDRILLMNRGRIHKDQMAVVRAPDGVLSVKTCILTGGDEIIIRGNFLVAGEKSFFLQPYQKEVLSAYDRVPGGGYFFAGENSFHSRDSRDWGFLEKKDIIGRVIAVRRMNR